MLAQLPAYLAAIAGDALVYELLLLVVFSLVIDVRRMLHRGLRWYRQQGETDDQIRAALWRILKG